MRRSASYIVCAWLAWTAILVYSLSSAHAATSIGLPIEVFGPAGTTRQVTVDIADPTQVTHLYLRCNACGYHDQRHDNDPTKVKATVSVNGGTPVPLKYYDGSGRVVGNSAIEIIGPEKHYGGIGGGFRTVRFTLPISGLVRGNNVLTFTHQNPMPPSMGFRIIELNLLENNSLDRKILSEVDFIEDDPTRWTPPLNNPTAIEAGRRLWERRNSLYDPVVDRLNGNGSGIIKAACADCHARDGRDLAYFNFSSDSISKRAQFHGLSEADGMRIASYIRSLQIPVVASARPWNPPYQPGPDLDSRPAYEWAAGAGIDAVLEQDSDMHNYLFPQGTSLPLVKDVVDRKSSLNMRQLPIAIALPEWNQWLPPIHPDDALNTQSAAVRSDAAGNPVNRPYYNVLYDRARANPTPDNLGAMVSNLRDWSSRDATCYSVGDGREAAPLRALNGAIWGRSMALPRPPLTDCSEDRKDYDALETIEFAKQALLGWTSVKYWEIIHGNALETQAGNLPPILYRGARVRVSEARGWRVNSQTVFNRAPHYLSHNSRHFGAQDMRVGAYDSSAWYHLNMILNTGYRQTMPSHFVYTINYVENLQAHSRESQSYRFWATMIKMRQLQTNGRYGVEEGLDLRTAQPHYYYGDMRGDTSVRSGVGAALWNQLATAFIDDLVADARFATAADWANSTNNSQVQPRNSRNFSPIGTSTPLFDNNAMQGNNTYRLIPLLRQQGIRSGTLDNLINWCEATWPFGPWQNVR